MKATCSSETADEFQRTTRRYISDDRTVHNHRCENVKSCTETHAVRHSQQLGLHTFRERMSVNMSLLYTSLNAQV
jgi:hypothetical protein